MNPRPGRATGARCSKPGGANDAALLVKEFLGRDYSFDAYETLAQRRSLNSRHSRPLGESD